MDYVRHPYEVGIHLNFGPEPFFGIPTAYPTVKINSLLKDKSALNRQGFKLQSQNKSQFTLT